MIYLKIINTAFDFKGVNTKYANKIAQSKAVLR